MFFFFLPLAFLLFCSSSIHCLPLLCHLFIHQCTIGPRCACNTRCSKTEAPLGSSLFFFTTYLLYYSITILLAVLPLPHDISARFHRRYLLNTTSSPKYLYTTTCEVTYIQVQSSTADCWTYLPGCLG
ncbi:hypothetical protein F5Y14DRAFT_17313 [Nemania sp. NC0429]|nr:hypothetical protein F5Y14DRAFT_17313 [Nemania sp. NC0429]